MPRVDLIVPGFTIRSDRTRLGLSTVALVRGQRTTVVDAAIYGRRTWIVDRLRALDVAPEQVDALVLTQPANPRRLAAEALADVASTVLPAADRHVVADVHDALAAARTLAGSRGTVLATGSLHLVADLRRGRGAGPGARY